MNFPFRIKSLLFVFFIVSCATEAGKKVRLASQVGSDCEFIGSVSASMGSRGFNQTDSIKNNAAEVGANWVVVTGHRNGEPDTGESYKCPDMKGSAKRVDNAIYIETKSDSTITHNNSSNESDPAYQKLKNLQKMLDDNLITSEDFKIKKKKILEEM